jgi:hypothetical protein
MPLLSKADLQFTYSWTAALPDDPGSSGKPDGTSFDRRDGYEVLYLINKFAERNNLSRKEAGLKAERMINRALPGDVRKEEQVIKWLAYHWQNHT